MDVLCLKKKDSTSHSLIVVRKDENKLYFTNKL